MVDNSPLKTITWKNALYLILVSAGVGFLVTNWFRDGMDLIMTPLASASLILVCVILLVYGLRIRRWNNRPLPEHIPDKAAASPQRNEKNSPSRRRPVSPIDPIQAVRTVILAQASIITASLLIGWHGGIAVFRLENWITHTPYVKIFYVAIALLTSTVLLIVGFLVQKWCRIPPRKMCRDRSLRMTEPTV